MVAFRYLSIKWHVVFKKYIKNIILISRISKMLCNSEFPLDYLLGLLSNYLSNILSNVLSIYLKNLYINRPIYIFKFSTQVSIPLNITKYVR